MEPGIYCLVLSNRHAMIRVGSLGHIDFKEGWYVYTGSALGPGGLLRVSRHIRLAGAEQKKLKWHIDYILTDKRFCLRYSVSSYTTERLECVVAGNLGGSPVHHFGSSDCKCNSHLSYFPMDPLDIVVTAFAASGLSPAIKTINTEKRQDTVK